MSIFREYKKVKKLILLILPLIIYSSFANDVNIRVFFKDKGPIAWSNVDTNQLFLKTKAIISLKAIERRSKVLQSPYISYDDAPLYSPYISTIENMGGKILSRLRWNNYAVFSIDSSKVDLINSLGFVKSTQLTNKKLMLLSTSNSEEYQKYLMDSIDPSINLICAEYRYGSSYYQNNLLNVINLHSMGITGQGVNLGILDNGFQYTIHNSLRKTNIIKTHDFVYNDSLVYNEAYDVPAQDGHGSICFATIAAFYQDSLIGIAPSSNFYLGKTEDMRGETRIEEDWYAEGIEWLEANGADISTASLGYYTYDSSDESYIYEDLDGKSTVSGNALNNAVKRGMICFAPAGNSGPGGKSIITPGDADSAITVGSVDKDGVISGFSSRGTNGSGKIKPDFLTMGAGTYTIASQSTDGFINASGTSLATPQLAGAASLILTVFPEIKPWEFKNILISASSNQSTPDSILGYGIPNIDKSIRNYDIAIAPLNHIILKNKKRIFSYIFSNSEISKVSLFFKNYQSATFEEIEMLHLNGSDRFICDIPLEKFSNKDAQVYIVANDLNGRIRRFPFDNQKYSLISPLYDEIQCGINENYLPVYEINEEKNIVYPNIIQSGNNINIKIKTESELLVKISLFNNLGQEIQKFDDFYSKKGINIQNISIKNISSGNYFIKINYLENIEFHSLKIIN